MLARSLITVVLLFGCREGEGSAGTSASPVEAATVAAPPSVPSVVSATPSAAVSAPARSGVGPVASLKASSLREMDVVRGKRLEVRGIFIKRTVSRNGGPPSEHPLLTNNMVWLADAKEGTDLLRCDLGEAWASGVQPFDTVLASGIAAFEDPATIHNGPKELRLASCTVKKAE